MMTIFLYAMAAIYSTGALLHVLDLFDLRRDFSHMNLAWRVWVVYLLIADAIAALGLWRRRQYGEYAFLFVSASQAIVYLTSDLFGNQNVLASFHSVCLCVYVLLRLHQRSDSQVLREVTTWRQ